MNLKGTDSTVGLMKLVDNPCSETMSVVEDLINEGCIPFVKTNVPQTLLSFECSNPLWGRTVNPYCKDLTPGGSSGGEAALIASDGSVLGIGSDIGGSLRIPAHFTGKHPSLQFDASFI
jgi:Asp-tRNA(Asn)/Glu-tRNA(Gln) amidotransferase A subunit family amidase